MAGSSHSKRPISERQGEIEAMLADMAAARERATKKHRKWTNHFFKDLNSGWLGATVAGGVYLIAIGLIDLLSATPWDFWVAMPGDGWTDNAAQILSFLSWSPFAFLGGMWWAAFFGAMIFPLSSLAASFCKLRQWSHAVATFAGGMTGLVASSPLYFAMGEDDVAYAYALIMLATVMGQFGAWWMTWRKSREDERWGPPLPPRQELPLFQLTLEQLFRITTVVAIAAAVLSAIGTPREMLDLLVCGMAIQVATLTLMWLARRRRGRKMFT